MSQKIIQYSLTFFALWLLNGCGPAGAGDTAQHQTFYLDATAGGHKTRATLRKTVADVATKFGRKTLKIWVSDDSYGAQSTKTYAVTQEMVDALANAFLRPGADNDIYDWDTAIYGEEWGEAAHDKYSNLIEADNEINILLTDIDNDNRAHGGAIGYFYAKDNYTRDTISGSNKRIMFYIDSVMFANDEGGFSGWDIRDRWPSETLSTLAHEFQHMIHFYQKTVLLTDGTSTQTWIDEMLAETTEDVVASKIGIPGPRAVDAEDGSAGEPDNQYGRYPGFNAAGRALSLTQWGYSVPDYSKVSAFGAYLIRQYGGPKLLHDIMHNAYTDQQAVLDAVHRYPGAEYKTFDNLLRDWGVAVLLSDQTTLPDALPQYNTGAYTPGTYHGITYDLGSINFFNYTPKPTLYTGSGTVRLAPMSNLYYEIGENISGDHKLSLDIKKWTTATLVIKNHAGTGSDSGSNTNIQVEGTDANRTITVTAGDDPSADYLANQGHINLTLKLGARARDVYIVLSNSDNSDSDTDTHIQNGRRTKQSQELSSPHSPHKRASKLFAAQSTGLSHQAHRFNHHAGDYLKKPAAKTKDAQ